MAARLVIAISLVATTACSGAQTADSAATASASAPVEEAPPPADADDDDPQPRPLEVKGEVDGKPYQPVLAIGNAVFKRDGKLHLVMELVEKERGCDKKATATKGQRQLMVALPWEGGAKLDLSAPPPDMDFNPNKMKIWNGSRWDEANSWRAPFGSVTVFEAPTKSGEKGRVRFKLRSGQLRMKGDLPVLLCVDAV